jgi:hypothetical protein
MKGKTNPINRYIQSPGHGRVRPDPARAAGAAVRHHGVRAAAVHLCHHHLRLARGRPLRHGGGRLANNLPRFRDCAGMREAAKKVGILSNLRDEDILIWYDYGPGTATYGFDCSPNVDVPLGSRVVVQVHTPYAPIVPMVPINLNQVEAASARTIVKDVSVGVAAVPPPPESENPPPFVSFEIASQSGPESGYMEVNVILRDASGNPTVAPQSITISFDVSGTAEQGVDYTLSTNPLIIPAGQGGATFRINVIEDTLYEADETVVLSISNIENGRYGAILVHTATILNDDPAPLISFRYESSNISEAALDATTNRVANIEVRLDAGLRPAGLCHAGAERHGRARAGLRAADPLPGGDPGRLDQRLRHAGDHRRPDGRGR